MLNKKVIIIVTIIIYFILIIKTKLFKNMDYYYILLLVIAAFLSIKGEQKATRKKLFIWIYIVLISVALMYNFGESIGQMIYRITNT